MTPLQPSLNAEQLYPAKSVYMARTRLPEVCMLGYTELQLDSATSMLMGLLNGYATVRHEACTGSEIFELFASAGIEVHEDIHNYRNETEAVAAATALTRNGHKLFWPYPLPAELYPQASHLVAPELYRRLNAKQHLSDLVPAEHLAWQQCLSHAQLASVTAQQPLCLKAGGNAATGWGYAVFPCRNADELDFARQWFAEHQASVPLVLAEQWLDIDCSWCVGLAISETGTRSFGGAEQLFSSPCKQSGSLIDPARAMPEEVEKLAVQIGESAGAQGFRGIAGLDIGLAQNGQIVVFDPNFRIASSTAQLLFHQSASSRAGLPASQSIQLTPAGSFSEMERKLRGPIADGWFIPTRLFNGEKHPLSGGKHIVTGFVLGKDRQSTSSAMQKLQDLF